MSNRYDININQVLRYLGYKGQQVDDKTIELIDKCINECKQGCHPKYYYQEFDIKADRQKIIYIEDVGLCLKGKDIYNHLKCAKHCVIMGATLGVEFDNMIRVAQVESMTKALILDACGSSYIEKVCDVAQDEIQKKAQQKDMSINYRFSPGYGDLDLSCQPDLIRAIDGYRKLGLTCTNSYIMLPKKSVTALIGVFDGKSGRKEINCANCNINKTCEFKKGV